MDMEGFAGIFLWMTLLITGSALIIFILTHTAFGSVSAPY